MSVFVLPITTIFFMRLLSNHTKYFFIF